MDGSVLYTHAAPPHPFSLPPLSLESNPCFSIINPSWIQDTAGRPFKSSGTSTESRVLVRVTDGLYALPMHHGIILKSLLFDRGGGNRGGHGRRAGRVLRFIALPACFRTFFFSFYVQYRRILELFRSVLSPRVSRTGHLAPSSIYPCPSSSLNLTGHSSHWRMFMIP